MENLQRLQQAPHKPDYFSYAELNVSKGLNHLIATLAALVGKYLIRKLRFFRGDSCIICNSEDFYIRARIRRRLVLGSAKSRHLPFAKLTLQLRGQTGCVRDASPKELLIRARRSAVDGAAFPAR